MEFKILNGDNFIFYPGQFIALDLLSTNGEKIRRSYSISNYDKKEKIIELVITFIENGNGSNFLCSLKEGSVLTAIGPRGNFLFKKENPGRHILVGTGTGIVPYKSMLTEISNFLNDEKNSCILIQGVKFREDIIFREDFEKLSNDKKNFLFKVYLSRENNHEEKKSYESFGYVQDYFKELNLNAKRDTIYLCGNPYMIEDSINILSEINFSKEKIVTEKYFKKK